MSNTYKDLLVTVSKPSRYMGHEINSVQKDMSEIKTRVALIFPDTYEIGMSHLGLKILYHILNNMEGVAAERAFVPWIDMEGVLIRNGLPLISIESSTPLNNFDILGINLPYELSYTNILTVLSLAGIPFYSRDRENGFPLIIGGGTAVFNPEPVADFFDAFLIGDGEEAVVDIVNIFNQWKGSGRSKEALLRDLSNIAGVYIPSFYNVLYNTDGTIQSVQAEEGILAKIKRRIIEDLDKAPFPVSAPMPYMQVVHDRLTVEITRGCTHGCRFCQAGMIYRPVRERSPEKILEILEESLKNTGYEEVTLSSLSTGDFGCLSDMMDTLLKKYTDKHVSFSLPSLRVETLTPTLIDQITAEKNSSFTVAPEAGTDRLRKVINKEMDESVFETTVHDVFKRGVKSLKLYFMVCLPTETDDDLDGIVSLAKRAKDIARKYGKRGKDITVSVSTFVPKPHTPFQWYGQVSREEIERRIKYLKAGLYKVGVSFKFHNLEMSHLEAVFSRGDRRLSKVIEATWNMGSRFDSWTDRFDSQKWKSAFEQCNIDPHYYSSRNIFLDEILPWEHIETGVTKEFLIKEYNRAVSGRLIPDCRYGNCPNCGVCDMDAVRGRKEEGIRPIARSKKQEVRSQTEEVRSKITDAFTIPPPLTGGGQGEGELRGIVHSAQYTPHLLRVCYEKTGDMRMLSQLEIISTFSRAFRRASIPTAFSEGFHPHPKLSFGPALPVGVESSCEYMDVELTGTVSTETFKDEVNKRLPAGLQLLSVKEIPINSPSLNSFIKFYAYQMRFNPLNPPLNKGGDMSTQNPPLVVKGGQGGLFSDELNHNIINLPETGELWATRLVEKDGRKVLRKINTRPFIEYISQVENDMMFILLKTVGNECCRPSDVISAMINITANDPQILNGILTGLLIRRIGLYGNRGGEIVSPEGIPWTRPREQICLQR